MGRGYARKSFFQKTLEAPRGAFWRGLAVWRGARIRGFCNRSRGEDGTTTDHLTTHAAAPSGEGRELEAPRDDAGRGNGER